MQLFKEILIFLSFLVLSSLVWLINAQDKQAQQSPSDGVEQEGQTQESVTEKKLELPVEVMDVPEDRSMRVFPSVVTVYVRVYLSDFESISSNDVRVWCTYPTRQSEVINLHTDVTKKEILGVRTVPDKVEYIIEYPQEGSD